MLDFVKKYAKNIMFSQNGEEGILLECLERLTFHVNKGHAVEIGGHDGRFCSNTALLLLSYGWTGAFVESDYRLWGECSNNWKDYPVKCICSSVNEDNINAFVDDSCDVLSLDTDGSDFQIFKGLRAKPKIVIIEIDSSIPPDVEGFNSDGGASYLTMLKLAHEKDYFLLAHTGNMVLVLNEFRHLFPEVNKTSALMQPDLYFKRDWLKENAA